MVALQSAANSAEWLVLYQGNVSGLVSDHKYGLCLRSLSSEVCGPSVIYMCVYLACPCLMKSLSVFCIHNYVYNAHMAYWNYPYFNHTLLHVWSTYVYHLGLVNCESTMLCERTKFPLLGC